MVFFSDRVSRFLKVLDKNEKAKGLFISSWWSLPCAGRHHLLWHLPGEERKLSQGEWEVSVSVLNVMKLCSDKCSSR